PAGSLVKVMDFGVARLDDASRTRTGLVLGTPSFMSPEQMAGRHADGRSDLYSLGVALFQLLTGRLPHEGASMAELMRQIVNEPAPDVRTLRPELPAALADVVALALEKRPEMRYADGVQMAQDLRMVAAAMLAPAPPEPVPADAFEKTVTFPPVEPRHNSGS
ncbi:protein kinase, partial [Variovorax sp. YR752]|uniref:protein kinase domain-containing protein n=1 Tax=Variovorax sp. YR752 TaxID=1884383 RepID=UPI00313816B8